MFLTDDEIAERLSSPINLPNRLQVHESQTGKRGTQVPDEIKEVIAVLANEGEDQKDLSKAFGVPQSAVSLYENGKTSGGPKKELQDAIARVKTQRKGVEGRAITALMDSVGLLSDQLTGEEAAKIKPRDLAAIAKDMAVVADKIRPAEERSVETAVHLHLYRPQMATLDDYEIIHVNDSKQE